MKKPLFLVSLFLSLLIVSFLITDLESKAASPKVRLNVKTVELTKNQKYSLRVYNTKKKYKVYFSTDDETVINLPKVSPKARKIQFTTINTGTTTINVTIKKNKKIIAKLSCSVTVTPQAISVKFKKKSFEMKIGTTLLLKPIIKPYNSSCVPTYTSSDEQIVVINAKGRVQALSVGEVTITATLPTGQSTSCKIIVWDPNPYMSFKLPAF